MTRTLHYHPLSSYCHKVLIALYELDLPFEPQVIDFGSAESRAAFLALWPTGKMPLLVDEGKVIPESSIIIEHLQRRTQTSARLIPDADEAALTVRLWDRVFDQYVMTPMQALVGRRLRPANDGDESATAADLAMLRKAYGMIERQLAGQEWICGEHFSMADCAAAPALFYAATLADFAEEHAALGAYFERLVRRPSVQRVLTEARPYFQHYPVKDAIAPRFLHGDH